jgi:hypothetical protein
MIRVITFILFISFGCSTTKLNTDNVKVNKIQLYPDKRITYEI